MEGWKVTINMDFNMKIEKHDFNIFKVSSTSHQELYFTPPPLLFVYLRTFKSIGEHQSLLSCVNKQSIKLLQQETLFPKAILLLFGVYHCKCNLGKSNTWKRITLESVSILGHAKMERGANKRTKVVQKIAKIK